VLRRVRHWREARSFLEAARAIFALHGAALWEARTLGELQRIGGRRTTAGLTPTEAQIARVVADGHSNKEAAAQLSVTVRTIESNLSRIYAKLGIRSRTELAAQLGKR
jgi:DNA-binding NarL/FixJ family response regulator